MAIKRSKKKIIKKSKKKYNGETIIFNGFKDKSVPFKYNNNLLETHHFENLTSVILKNASGTTLGNFYLHAAGDSVIVEKAADETITIADGHASAVGSPRS